LIDQFIYLFISVLVLDIMTWLDRYVVICRVALARQPDGIPFC